MLDCETFTIEAYSGPKREQPSIWADHWKCPLGCEDMTPETVDFDTYCPLHNPMYCSGRRTHPVVSCTPYGEVFLYNINERERTIIGRIK